MPMPTGNQTWPPTDFNDVAAKYAEYSAWYSGDPSQLRDVYQRQSPVSRIDRPAQYRAGVTGALARMWWGRPIGDLTRRQDSLHVPLASDICQASADLLFSEPPTITSSDEATQKRIDILTDNGLLSTMAESAELSAALGGAFQRVTWAKDSGREGAFLTNVDADGAYPVFRWGNLAEVTFWWTVSADPSSTTVWRHLEHHELDATGVGVIFHALFRGTPDNLGQIQPLADHPSTEGLAATVDQESKISTLSPGLAVEYFPNQLPQRLLRKHPIGRNLGRSDLSGIEGLMDSIDETYSSWMRDIRLAKGRVMAPQYMLDGQGPGRGAILDLDQDVFVGLNMPPQADGSAGLTINQFAIRVQEHQGTIAGLVKTALRTAGYSADTFGEGDQGGMKTATEVVSEQNRSYMTRDRKIRLLLPRQLRILKKLLAVDQAIFSSGVKTDDLEMQFADGVQTDPEALARTSQLLFAAQSASIKTRVQMQHPDWDNTQVDEEVALIQGENMISVPDPADPAPFQGTPPDGPPASVN